MIGSQNHIPENPTSVTPGNSKPDLKKLIIEWDSLIFEESAIPSLIKDIASNEPEKQCYGVFGFKKLLCEDKDRPIQAVIDSGVVPTLIELIRSSSIPEIQLEAGWALTNLCSGTTEQTKILINYGVIPGFISLVKSENSDIIEQGMWGLGNITGDGFEMIDLVLKAGGL